MRVTVDSNVFTPAEISRVGFDVPAVVQNVGPDVEFKPDPQGKDPLPLTFRLAAARPLIVSPSF